jgi:AraC-like DNA-binding protein
MFRRLCEARDALCAVDGAGPAPSIREIAAGVRMSPYQLIRRFEALFGETPHQRRIRARVERAKQLLALGRGSVTEVCMEVGFSSLGSFSDLFTRRVGEAPSAYRRRMRVLVSVPGGLPAHIAPGCFSLMAFLPAGGAAQFSRSTI